MASISQSRLIKDSLDRATVVVGASGPLAQGVFIDPIELSNALTEGGATGFLSSYVMSIEEIQWSVGDGNFVLHWESTDNERAFGGNGDGHVRFKDDYSFTLGPKYTGATGFTGKLFGTVSGNPGEWHIIITVRKPGAYFGVDRYPTS